MKNNAPIILVEDDQVDAMTVQRALAEIKVSNPLVHFKNGEDAWYFLSQKLEVKPCIILLDLNMPRMNGLEFLERIKQDPNNRSIPVIILTTSTEYQDRSQSFDLSVAGYMVKPVNYKQFVEMMITISHYWRQSELP